MSGLPEYVEGLKWDADYQQLLAIDKSWFPWWSGWQVWPLIWLGNDEYFRRTLVVGPLVFPLWRCRCRECRELVAEIRARVDSD
jgi:hypothetical protein